MTSWRFVASAGTAELEIVRAVSPLAVDLFLPCGPVCVPFAVSATEATLEEQDNAPARILRSFLNHDPWEGMGSVGGGGWMLLADGDEAMVFAQRQGPIGFGPIVTLSRRDEHGNLTPWFQSMTMGGDHRLLLGRGDDLDPEAGPIEWPVPVFGARIADRSSTTVYVPWACSRDQAGVPDRVHARTAIVETNREVHVLLIAAAHPDHRPPPRGGRAPGRPRRRSGQRSEASFELTAPLGDRALFSDYGAPATTVHVMYDATPPTGPRGGHETR